MKRNSGSNCTRQSNIRYNLAMNKNRLQEKKNVFDNCSEMFNASPVVRSVAKRSRNFIEYVGCFQAYDSNQHENLTKSLDTPGMLVAPCCY